MNNKVFTKVIKKGKVWGLGAEAIEIGLEQAPFVFIFFYFFPHLNT